MFINEVVHIVGLSRKSIRYYEENGLLTPTRNKDNKYRIYNEEDIKKLKIIKFLRELDVPINDLKRLNTKEITLKECLNEKIRQIENEEKRYAKVKHMCNEINKTNETIETLNITNYFCEMNKLNKEGFTMRNTKTKKSKKIIGACLSSFIFGTIFIFLIAIISYFQFSEEHNIPWLVYWFIMLILGIPLLGIIYNLVARIKEILGGEEDEASKY